MREITSHRMTPAYVMQLSELNACLPPCAAINGCGTVLGLGGLLSEGVRSLSSLGNITSLSLPILDWPIYCKPVSKKLQLLLGYLLMFYNWPDAVCNLAKPETPYTLGKIPEYY